MLLGNTDDSLILEKWTLRNAWVQKITPSELDYENEELSTIEIVLVYDWAELKVLDLPEIIHLPTVTPFGG